MSKEITQGRIHRYIYRYESLGHKNPIGLTGLGRRATLKALRDAMSMTRNEMRRRARRSKYVQRSI